MRLLLDGTKEPSTLETGVVAWRRGGAHRLESGEDGLVGDRGRAQAGQRYTSTQPWLAELFSSFSKICNCRKPSANCGYSTGAER